VLEVSVIYRGLCIISDGRTMAGVDRIALAKNSIWMSRVSLTMKLTLVESSKASTNV